MSCLMTAVHVGMAAEILTSEIFRSLPNDPKLTSQPKRKVPHILYFITPRVLSVRPFRSTISCARYISHLRTSH